MKKSSYLLTLFICAYFVRLAVVYVVDTPVDISFARQLLYSGIDAVTCVTACWIASRITTWFIGIYAGLLLALYPDAVLNSVMCSDTVLWGFLIAVSIWSAVYFQRDYKIGYGILIGITVSMASLLVPATIFFPPCYGLLYIVFYAKNSIRNCLKLLLIPTCMVGVITCSVWIVRYDTFSPFWDSIRLLPAVGVHGGLTVWTGRIILFVPAGYSILLTRRIKLFMPMHGLMITALLHILIFRRYTGIVAALSPVLTIYAGSVLGIISEKVLKQRIPSNNEWRYRKITV